MMMGGETQEGYTKNSNESNTSSPPPLDTRKATISPSPAFGTATTRSTIEMSRGIDDDGAGGEKAPTRGITNRLVVIIVAAYCLAFFVESGLENGIGPCLYTTFEREFDTSVTAVAVAQNMAEVSKIIGSLGVSYLGQSEHRMLFTVIGCFVWAAGTIVVGISTNIYLAGLGFCIFGLGYSTVTVLVAPVLSQITPGDKQRQTLLLSAVYAVGALGVAVGFVICGFTTSVWRLNFFLYPLGLIPVVVLLTTGYHGVSHTFTRNTSAGVGEDGKKKSLKNPVTFMKTLKESQKGSPPLIPTVKWVLSNPGVIGSIFIQIFTAFYINAFTQLTPKFIEEGLGQTAGTASFIMAATVPCVCVGMVLGGYICKKMALPLHKMMLFCAFSSGASIPMMFIFLTDSLALFVVGLLFAMITAFMNASPQITALALSCELKDKLQAHVPDRPPPDAAISIANGMTAVISRILGSICGPIVLSALIDHSETLTKCTSFPIELEGSSSGSSSSLSFYNATATPTRMICPPEPFLTFRMCYLIVGLVGSIFCTLGALYAWRTTKQMEHEEEQLKKHGTGSNHMLSGSDARTPVGGGPDTSSSSGVGLGKTIEDDKIDLI